MLQAATLIFIYQGHFTYYTFKCALKLFFFLSIGGMNENMFGDT